MPVRSKWQSLPTEQINPATLAIDKLSPADIVEGMLNEDRKMLAAVHREKDRIAVGIEIITQALRRGGRIVFVGAGTSGRLGVLEAAEMPPTFGTSPDLVQAIMAGGKGAIVTSTNVCSSVRGSQVTKMIFDAALRARVNAPRTNGVIPLADTPITTSFLVGRSRFTERAPSS